MTDVQTNDAQTGPAPDMVRIVDHVPVEELDDETLADIVVSALAQRIPWILSLAAGLALGASVIGSRTGALVLIAFSLTFLFLAALLRLMAAPPRVHQMEELHRLLRFLEGESAPSLLFSADQSILWLNISARQMLPEVPLKGLVAGLKPLLPDPGATVRRLRTRLSDRERIDEDIAVRRGTARAVLRRLPGELFLLRFENITDRPAEQVAGVNLPVMIVSAKGTILTMNEPLRLLAGARMRTIGQMFERPNVASGQLCDLHRADGEMVPVRLYRTALTGDRQEIAVLPEMPDLAEERGGTALSLDTLPVALAELGRGGRVLRTNLAARRLLGVTASDLPADFADLVTGLGRDVSDWIDGSLDAPGPLKPEVLRVRRTPEEVFLQVSLAHPREGQGDRVLAVLHDATELKTLEAQFVQSQKMQAIGQLAGGVAHDFNNLLTAISGHCDLMLLRHDPGDGDYADLVQIAQNANRAAALVGQLLAFSRKQTLLPEVLDVRDALADLTHLLNRLVGETITLSLLHDPDLPTIRADRRQLEQVIMNLVVNARDAMPDGGDIVVETRRTVLSEPLTRGRAVVPPGEYATIAVSDHGVGIPPEVLGKIFEPFFTTKRTGEGTGLGLSTAYGIIKQSGGFIFADSHVGKGSEFTIFLPANTTAAAPEPPALPVSVPAETSGEGVILLVEDEAPVRAFAARALRLRGYTVLEAATAEEALDMLERDALEVDLFVSDVIMPGMDGPTWVRKAREKRPDIKAVFVSGYAEDLLSGQQAGLEQAVFLPKPFSLAQLTETVQRQLS